MGQPDHDRMRALQRANQIRAVRAGLKQRIAAGELSASGLILNPPAEVEGWSVEGLLVSQRGWGGAKCKKLLSRTEIDGAKTVGGLTERQRQALVAELELMLRGRSAAARR